MLENIMFGDVWLCIGEGNMQFPLQNIYNATDEIAKVQKYKDQIRYASTSESYYRCSERDDTSYMWSVTDSSSTSVFSFSAICLLYGVEIAKLKPGRPIGLIQASRLLSTIESLGSKRVTDQCKTTSSCSTSTYDIDGATSNVFWNVFIYPLTKMAIRGIIWNQGESNVGYNQDKYACQLQAIYEDYKDTFFNGNISVLNENNIAFPFGILQLGTMKSGRKDAWGSLRWLQTFSNGIVPNDYYPEIFMASTYDLTDSESPFGSSLSRDKQSAAQRLAKAAGGLLYNATTALVGPYSVSAERGAAGVIGLTFSSKVVVRGTEGFTYLTPQGEWFAAPKFLQISETKIGVAIPEDAVKLAYAWNPTVCEYKNCALYSGDNMHSLPVQAWIWNVDPRYTTTPWDITDDLQIHIFTF